MNKYTHLFQQAKSIVLGITLFMFPLLFLTTTQEYFATTKLYFLSLAAIALLLISACEMFVEKRLRIKRDFLDLFKLSFILALFCSLLTSPNKIQALLNVNFGIVTIVSLAVISFYLKRSSIVVMKILPISGLILSLIALIYFFQPFEKAQLPNYLLFLKNPYFTPLGNQLDLAIFLGFIATTQLVQIIFIDKVGHQTKQVPWTHLGLLGISILSLILTIYALLRGAMPQLPPFSYSWYSAIEILKNPVTALFGIGLDNFASIFTKVKDIGYNQLPFWQLGSFNVSRSALLHILAETGIFGLFSFILLLSMLIKKGWQENRLILIPIFYMAIVLFVFPPSLLVFFLFFVALTVLDEHDHERKNLLDVDLVKSPAYIAFPVFVFIITAFCLFFLGRAYLAEYYFKQSIDGLAANDARRLYDNQRNAIAVNPFIERYRINFSQTNLLIASNIAAKVRPTGDRLESEPTELTEQDRQIISQAIQAAIEEAKAAVTLNQQKAGNWENLALIYRNLVNTAQGADSWTISSYQRAIILDPQNPQYRMNLGGVYYSLNLLDEAIAFFSQAVALKPNWPNAHYNLAWSYYQKKDYQKAVDEMQSVLGLLDPKKDAADFKKAKDEFDNFSSFLTKTNNVDADESSEQNAQPKTLPLPTPRVATVEPKIQLPKEASPEAGP